jgi:hypothetical protein
MGRRRTKKLLTQTVVGTATAGLPQPLRKVLGSRWGSRLAILVAIVLFTTGIATIDWTNGSPRLKINRDRAQEVRQEVRERAESVANHALEIRR